MSVAPSTALSTSCAEMAETTLRAHRNTIMILILIRTPPPRTHNPQGSGIWTKLKYDHNPDTNTKKASSQDQLIEGGRKNDCRRNIIWCKSVCRFCLEFAFHTCTMQCI